MDYKISYRKKDKGYQAIVSYKDRRGRWRQKTKQGYSSIPEVKRGCDKLLTALKQDYKRELLHGNHSITLGEFSDIYIEDITPHLAHNTLRLVIVSLDSFGHKDVQISKIGYADIQNWINKLIDSEYSYNTIKIYVGQLKTMLTKAVNSYKVISESPADTVTMPKDKSDKEGIKALSQTELNHLLSYMKPYKDYVICLIASHCGLRIGEIIGLTIADIDLKKNTISINKQWKHLKTSKDKKRIYGFGSPKSKNSYRTVPIPPMASVSIGKYINDTPIGIDGRIFPGEDPFKSSDRIRYKIKKHYPDMNFHSLRHTYATTLIANGVDFKTVAMLLGDTVEMVLKVYSHVTDDMIQSATDKINNIFG